REPPARPLAQHQAEGLEQTADGVLQGPPLRDQAVARLEHGAHLVRPIALDVDRMVEVGP
ncbi:hypothetical protein RZS08_40425, partial [Arthrospira platensis SPKY1]|nr:hypothetical protein [Arthrospira platensis SPKY1]